MTKPHGTIICPRCNGTQSGLLDLICDDCGLPSWDIEELKHGIRKLEIANQKNDDCLFIGDCHLSPCSDGCTSYTPNLTLTCA